MSGALWFATAAAYRLADRVAGAGLEPVLARQLAAGASPGPCPSPAHVAARLAALAGRSGEAAQAFAGARRDYTGSGHRSVLALVDAEHAALGEPEASALAARAAGAFEELGMTGWLAPADPPARNPLTGREEEVLQLLAAGLTNKEIAARLTLSLLTVNRHVANIYVKLGTRNRAEATAWAVRHRGPT